MPKNNPITKESLKKGIAQLEIEGKFKNSQEMEEAIDEQLKESGEDLEYECGECGKSIPDLQTCPYCQANLEEDDEDDEDDEDEEDDEEDKAAEEDGEESDDEEDEEEDDLEGKSVKELKAIAKEEEVDIKGLKKAEEIIEAIKAARNEDDEDGDDEDEDEDDEDEKEEPKKSSKAAGKDKGKEKEKDQPKAKDKEKKTAPKASGDYEKVLTAVEKALGKGYEKAERATGVVFLKDSKRILKVASTGKVEFNTPMKDADNLETFTDEQAKAKHLGSCRAIFYGDDMKQLAELVGQCKKKFGGAVEEDEEDEAPAKGKDKQKGNKKK